MKTTAKFFLNILETLAFTIMAQALVIPFASIYIRHYPEEYSIGSFALLWAVCTTAAAFADIDNLFTRIETKIRMSNWIHGN